MIRKNISVLMLMTLKYISRVVNIKMNPLIMSIIYIYIYIYIYITLVHQRVTTGVLI